METPSSEGVKDIRIIIESMENRPEIPPPDPAYPYPRHVPYAPAELLNKEKEKEKQKEESEEKEEEEEDEMESLEETSKEIALRKEIEAYEREEMKEIQKEIEIDRKLDKNYEKANKAVRDKAIEIADKEFELEILKKERALLRKKREFVIDMKSYKKDKDHMTALQKLHDDCKPYEEEEEEDEEYEKERIKREVFRYEKALEINAIEKKLKKQKKECLAKEKELAKEKNAIELEKAKYFEYQEQRKKEIEEEDAGKWPGEPRWGMLYL